MFFLTGTNMNKKTFDFTIIGGDMRQVCLAKLLALKGYCICHYGLCEPLKAPCIQPLDSLLEAVSSSSVCIAPIPFSKLLNKTPYLEFADLLWVEHMDLSLAAAKRSVLPQRVDQVVSADGCGLHPDDHIGELQRFHCRYDFSCQQFSTAKIVLHGKAAIFDSIRIHQARNVVLAAHINANEKPVDI